jgi:AcrR family transcriptional regulator
MTKIISERRARVSSADTVAPTPTGESSAKRDQKRTQVRQAAYECFSAKGYHATSVDDICAGAGISKGSFYWYYESKQAVLLSIVDGWSHEVEQQLLEHFTPTLTVGKRRMIVTEKLEAMSRRLRRLMPLWLEFLSQAQREPAVREGLSQFHRRVRHATHKLLSALVSSLTDPNESEPLATIIVGGFIGLMALELSDPAEVTFAKNVKAFMHLLGHSSIDATDDAPTGAARGRQPRREAKSVARMAANSQTKPKIKHTLNTANSRSKSKANKS